jgi:hypothetical protein
VVGLVCIKKALFLQFQVNIKKMKINKKNQKNKNKTILLMIDCTMLTPFFAIHPMEGKRRQMKNYDNTPCEAITAIHNTKRKGEKQFKRLVKEYLDEE